MSEVVVVDYGAGNLRSVSRAVAHAGFEAVVSAEPNVVAGARALIVPGVGAAADTMLHLREGGLEQPIRDHIAAGKPFLGVCMGMQALFDLSEEGGGHECLGVLPGRLAAQAGPLSRGAAGCRRKRDQTNRQNACHKFVLLRPAQRAQVSIMDYTPKRSPVPEF